MTDLPAEGWYDDPDGPGGLRWWTGAAWSDHREPPAASETPTPEEATTEEATTEETTPEPAATQTPLSTPPFAPPGTDAVAPAPTEPRSPADPVVPPPPPLPAPAMPVATSWQQPPGWQPAQPAPVSGRAAASLIVGLLWLFGLGSVIAIGLGILARRELSRSDTTIEGGGMAIAGIIVGVVGLVVALLLLAALV